MDHGKLEMGYINICSQGKKEELYLGSETVIIGRIVDDPLMISGKSSTANCTNKYEHSRRTSVQLELLQLRHQYKALS